MSIIAFWSNEKKETGQTMSMVALSTYMSIQHNYRILNVSANFNDTTTEDSYWNMEKLNNLVKTISNSTEIGLESGIEGLIKIINSNKTSTNIVSDYTKVVFKDRLDVLCAPKTKNFEEYIQICKRYPDILQVASRNYDLIFIDISKDMPEQEAKTILELADVIVVNMTQRLKTVDNYLALREENPFFKNNNILLNIGRYDKFSKYNVKNVTRYMKEKKDILTTPYNTLFFESCSEASVTGFFFNFIKLKGLEPDDRNAIFMQEMERAAKDLIYKLQELQIKM